MNGYVSDFKTQLLAARYVAKAHLLDSQKKMKALYDQKAESWSFEPGDKVLVLLPIPGDPLRVKLSGPYEVDRKLNDVNYVIKTPDRRKASKVLLLFPFPNRMGPCACV